MEKTLFTFTSNENINLFLLEYKSNKDAGILLLLPR